MKKERIKTTLYELSVLVFTCSVLGGAMYAGYKITEYLLPEESAAFWGVSHSNQSKIRVRFYRPADFTEENSSMQNAIATVDAKPGK